MRYLLFALFCLFFSVEANSRDINPKVVIFCYHSFNGNNAGYSIDEKTVGEHLRIAREKGFEIISQERVKDFYYNGSALNPKNLLITIDDGYESVYDAVKNIFINNGICPAVMLYPGSVGDGSYLKWNMIKEMAGSGISFGSHSYSHFHGLNFLRTADGKKSDEGLNKELVESAHIIEINTGSEVYSYAHPYGIFDRTIENITDIRYKLVYTTAKGPNGINTDPHRLNRYVINKNHSNTDIAEFLDYERLPVVKTHPENGGFVGNDAMIIFYFESRKEMKKYHGFKFMIDGDNFEIDVNIGRKIVWFDCKKIKRKVYDLSLKCFDEKNVKYIYSILINSGK